MKRILITILLVVLPASMAWADSEGLRLFEELKNLIISVTDSIKPAVVHIEVIKKRHGQRYETMGSGVVIDSDGYILTNEHVVEDQFEITISLESNREYRAEVIGTDKLTDLALLKVDIPDDINLKAAPLGNSDSVQVGEWVLAVGNPYGFDRSVSFGIISGKSRVLAASSVTPLLNDFIQTDAAIAPGSSGGPLVNLRGDVIGINSRGLGKTQGFTIPINIAIDVKNKLLKHGKIERGWLGLVTQPLNRSFAKFLGDPELEGILVADVLDGSPAKDAGIRSGDVLMMFEDVQLSAEKEDDLNKLTLAVAQSVIGESIDIEIYRDGDTTLVTTLIGEQPKIIEEEFESKLGFTVKEITDNIYRTYLLESKEGVLVTYVEIGTMASKGDLYSGDVILQVNDTKIKSFEHFKETIENLNDDNYILLRVNRGKDNNFALLDRSSVPKKDDDKESDGEDW